MLDPRFKTGVGSTPYLRNANVQWDRLDLSEARIVEKQPDFPAALSLLGMIDAGLGRKEEALREGRRACELLPISKDAITGAALAVNLAQIYAWVGEKDQALRLVDRLLQTPNGVTVPMLKLDPMWDPLGTDPRFQRLVASQAPSNTMR